MSGGMEMNAATWIEKLLVSGADSVRHLFKWRATVVSFSWVISVMWPWKRVKMRFLVWPTDCILHLLDVIT